MKGQLIEEGNRLPVKHIAAPAEVAEAYLFLMKYVLALTQCHIER